MYLIVQRHAYGAGQRQIYRGNPVQIDDLPVGYPDKPHLVQLLLQLVEPQADGVGFLRRLRGYPFAVGVEPEEVLLGQEQLLLPAADRDGAQG